MHGRFGRLGIGAVAVLLATLSAFAAAPQADSPKDTAAALARKARRAEKAGHASEAFVLYSEAAAIVPGNAKLTARMKAVQNRADTEAARRAAASSGPASAALADLPPAYDSITAREFAAASPMESPVTLMAKRGRQDFDLSGTARTIFEQIAQAFGLAAVFDSDFPATGPTLRFRVSAVDYQEALHDFEAVSGAFVTPMSQHLLLVAQDTPTKRTELERTVSLTVPFPQATTSQELTEVVQIVRQAMNVEKVAIDTLDNSIVIRDRISRAAPAQALLAQMFSFRPEVSVEVEFIEVADSDLINYGFNFTNNFQALALGTLFHNATTAPTGVTNLVSFGNGKTLIGLTVAQAQALFNETESNTQTLFRAQVRAVDGQPATFHVGERYPIETSGFAGATSTTTTGTSYSPPPVFQYQDLGVQLKVTPHIHGTGEVTLEVDTSYQLLTGNSVNNVPIIGRRQLTSQVRLRDDEWAVVAGLMSPSESKAVSGFWGLAEIPLLGNLFKQTSTQKTDSHILIAIKPHLLSLPADQLVAKPLRVGTETRPFTPM